MVQLSEYHTPLLVEIDDDSNINDLLADRVRSQGPLPAVEFKTDHGQWRTLTASQLDAEVVAVAKGLVARGIKPGDRVGIMAHTSVNWAILDWAIWAAGAVTVPLYETSSAEQVEWISRDSGIAHLFVESDAFLATVTEARTLGTVPDESNVGVFANGIMEGLKADGTSISDEAIASRRRHASAATVATIIYTSGTTGRPKGVELTHGNFVSLARNSVAEFPEIIAAPGAKVLLFLPLAHVFARFIHVLGMAGGSVVGYVGDIKSLLDDLNAFRPTWLLAVPRVFEKVYNGADQKASMEGKQKVFRWAAKTAIAYSRALDTPGGPKLTLRASHQVADRLVLRKIRTLLGGRVQYAISGGAALGERLGHFYRGLGILVLEGYGLTETTAPITVNLPRNIKIGTVGRPFPGCSVRIAQDGELLLAGPNVFHDYHNNPEATRAAFDGEWFRSGDIGMVDADGYVTITGRKKELIVTAGGKNVAPAILEDRLRGHPLVSQCVVVGDGQRFVAALITLDKEALPGWLKAHGKPTMTVAEAKHDPDVLRSLDQAVSRTNRAVSRAESIRKYRILDGDFTIENGYLTPSLKVKRHLVIRDFKDDIDAIYA
ncbi:AMP-dependent synthetase/ligase [Rarobacter incanus]|uniref:Acyl-CoA synthetase n=1 Tax=Rarobacter incanus TaxID=153494 RepID=A0A542SME4_9MICO|nr:AMP-dependent synthetase/ligase [Rarobacter incanus]TQK75800.1 long-chain acyl-CoA synthetase [Rarobacter incanus]